MCWVDGQLLQLLCARLLCWGWQCRRCCAGLLLGCCPACCVLEGVAVDGSSMPEQPAGQQEQHVGSVSAWESRTVWTLTHTGGRYCCCRKPQAAWLCPASWLGVLPERDASLDTVLGRRTSWVQKTIPAQTAMLFALKPLRQPRTQVWTQPKKNTQFVQVYHSNLRNCSNHQQLRFDPVSVCSGFYRAICSCMLSQGGCTCLGAAPNTHVARLALWSLSGALMSASVGPR